MKRRWHVLSEIDPVAKRATCSRCGPITVRFRVRPGQTSRWECSPSRDHRGEASPDARDAIRLRSRGANATKADVQAIRAGAACEVCAATSAGVRRLHIDHDHTTGRLRGLLCHACNLTLGHVKDDRSRLLALVAYLDRHERRPA